MDITDQEQALRRERLQQWIATNGGHAEVVKVRRLSGSQASFLSQLTGGYSFGPRAARKLEERLGMSPRWLDGVEFDRPNALGLSGGPPPKRAAYPDAVGVTDLLEMLGKVLKQSPPGRREALAINLAGWARQPEEDHWEQTVLALLQPQPSKQAAA